MNVLSHLQLILTKLPDVPGVYLFYNSAQELIYVGKATSLKSRVRSYFSRQKSPRPIEEMIHEVADIKWKETDSALEAIILESAYIKKFQPKYNVLGKDDKSWNYVVIMNETYPRIETLRQHEYIQCTEAERKKKYAYIFGPYPGLNTKEALKLLRKMFRFSTCQNTKRQKGKPCLYYQLGLCLGVCIGAITPTEYRVKIIRPLILFLRGEKKRLITQLAKEMQRAATEKKYEEAARLRDQLRSLERIQDIALLNKSFVQDTMPSDKNGFVLRRIEGYDISNLGSTGKVGSMVVFDAHGPMKSAYRKFTIKTVVGQSDVDCLAEVLTRRLAHSEWPLPEVFLIDGGLPQVNVARKIITAMHPSVPIVGIAKGAERKRNDFLLTSNSAQFLDWFKTHRELLIQVRDEAHRFAITFQRAKRQLRVRS